MVLGVVDYLVFGDIFNILDLPVVYILRSTALTALGERYGV